MDHINMQEFWEEVQGIQINAIQIISENKEIYCYDKKNGQRQNQYSITKSLTSAAAGLAIQEGMFGLDDPIEMYIREAREKQGWIRHLRIRHLLNMTQGFERPLLMGDERKTIRETDWISYICSQPVIHEPGTFFQYNNAGPYLLGVIIQRITGEDLVDYMMPRLFAPLGVSRPEAERCPMGYVFGAGGMMLNIRELGKFGQLYLQNGKWKGQQLISEKWIRQTTEADSCPIPENQAEYSYGYLFWISKDENLYMAKGKYGQFCIILPDAEAVISINSNEAYASEKIYESVKKRIIPQLSME